MALASVSTSRLVLLMVGAGISGATLYNNLDGFLSFFREVSRAAVHNLTKPSQGGTNNNTVRDSKELQSLAEQINRLSKEVSKSLYAVQESTARPYVTFVGSNNGRFGLVGTLSVCGSFVFVVFAAKRYLGFNIRDLAYVSTRRFNQAFETLRGAVSRISGALTQVREELSFKIKAVEDKVVESNISLEQKLQEEMEETRRDIYTVGGDVSEVRSIVGNMEVQLEELQNKLRFANRGIYLLCTVVSRLPENASVDLRPSLDSVQDELREFTSSRFIEKLGDNAKSGLSPSSDKGALLGLGSALADLEKINIAALGPTETNHDGLSYPEKEKRGNDNIGGYSDSKFQYLKNSASVNFLSSEPKKSWVMGKRVATDNGQ
eukprot:jgi/Galph1/5593/GphlegSOOS_G4211.1